MSATSPAASKVVAAVAAGYLLGRTKKMRLAITVAGLMAGRRLTGGGAGGLLHTVTASPEMQRLQDQLRGRLAEAAKTAAVTVATSRVEALTESLRAQESEGSDRAQDEDAQQQPDQGGQDQGSQDGDQGQGDQDQGDQDQGDQDQGDQDQGGRAASAAPVKRAAKKAPAKKAATAKAAAKRTPVKKTAAKRAPARG